MNWIGEVDRLGFNCRLLLTPTSLIRMQMDFLAALGSILAFQNDDWSFMLLCCPFVLIIYLSLLIMLEWCSGKISLFLLVQEYCCTVFGWLCSIPGLNGSLSFSNWLSHFSKNILTKVTKKLETFHKKIANS